MKKQIVWFFVCGCLCLGTAVAQTSRFLPRNINVSSYNAHYPAVSGDGQSMVFMSTYTQSEGYELRYTWKVNGQWTNPEPMPLVQDEKLNFIGGFSLNYDGTVFYFTSSRADGIGNFDIWYSERTGRNWSRPKNLGMPINSGTSEGFPSVSPDGRWLYFVRCGGMLVNRCVDCSVYRSKHRTGVYWEEPEVLPSVINTGHVTSPTLMPDNRTLVFATERTNGAGRMDLYWTRQENGVWTEPVAMDFLNDERHNDVVSIPAPGNVAYHPYHFQGSWRLTESLIPPEHRPLSIIQVSGMVTDENGNPLDAGIQVYNSDTQQQEQFVRTGDDGNGTFVLTMPEGAVWDFSIMTADQSYTYYAERFDGTDMEQSLRFLRNVQLEPARPGAVVLLPNITLDSMTLQADAGSVLDARRLTRMMQGARVKVRVQTVIPLLPPMPEVPMDSLAADTTALQVQDSTGEVYNLMADVLADVPLTQADMELVAWNRAEAIVNYFREQGIPERFMEKGVISWAAARALVGDSWTDERLRELVVVEVIE